MNQHGKAHLALIVSGLLFGANYWIAKAIMPTFTPFQIVGIRVFITTGLLWITGIFYKSQTQFSKNDLLRIGLAGITGVSLNQLLFFAGLRHSTPVETSILHTLSPVLVALFAMWILKEKIGLRKLTGIFSGLAGTTIIVTAGQELTPDNLHLKGNLFIVLNIIAYSLYLIIIKPVMEKHQPLLVLKYVFLAGFISFLPAFLFFPSEVVTIHASAGEWISLGYVVIGATFLTYLLTIYSIKRLPATIIGFYIYMQPFMAALIGYITGKEQLGPYDFIAAVFLFAGVWLVLGKSNSN